MKNETEKEGIASFLFFPEEVGSSPGYLGEKG